MLGRFCGAHCRGRDSSVYKYNSVSSIRPDSQTIEGKEEIARYRFMAGVRPVLELDRPVSYENIDDGLVCDPI